MIVLKILGIIAFLLFLIAVIPIRIRVAYDSGSVTAYIPVLLFRIKLYPRKPKLKSMSKKKYDKLKSEKKEKKKKKKDEEKTETAEKKKRISVSDVFGIVGEVTEAVKEILNKIADYLKVKIYALRIDVSCDDAAKTAVAYGAVSGSVSALMGILNDRCRISYSRNSDSGVYCDFTSGRSSVKVDLRFSVFVWQAAVLGIKSILSFIKIKSKLEDK